MTDDDLDLVEMKLLLDAVERRLNGGALTLVTATHNKEGSQKQLYYRGTLEAGLGLLVWGQHAMLNESLSDPEEGLGT